MLLTAIALSSFALQAGSAVAGHIAQNKRRNAVEDAANANYLSTLGDISARVGEETNKATLAIDRAGVQTSTAKGAAKASAAASGVQGRSIDLLLQDFDKDRLEHRTSVQRNLSAVRRQADRRIQAADAARQSQIAGVPAASPFATGLELGAAAVNTGNLLLRNRGGI